MQFLLLFFGLKPIVASKGMRNIKKELLDLLPVRSTSGYDFGSKTGAFQS